MVIYLCNYSWSLIIISFLSFCQKCFWSFLWHSFFLWYGNGSCQISAHDSWRCKARTRASRMCQSHIEVLCWLSTVSLWLCEQVHSKFCSDNRRRVLFFCQDDIWAAEKESTLCCCCWDGFYTIVSGNNICHLFLVCHTGKNCPSV